MKQFIINSPSGQRLSIQAYDLYHACNIAVMAENFKYQPKEYLNLNKLFCIK